MVSSPMYDRLMKFVEGVEESRKLRNYDSEHSTIIEGMGVMSSSVSHFKEYQGFEGQTGEAIDGWIDQAQQRYSSERRGYVGGVWVFRTVCFERVVLSSPGCLWPGRMDDHEEVLEAHA